MLQDISPARLDNVYHNYTPDSNSVLFSFSNDSVLSRISGTTIELPYYRELYPEEKGQSVFIYLFRIDQTHYFLVPETIPEKNSYQYNPIFSLRELQPKRSVFAIFTAYGLSNWYSTHIFCGKCGSKNQLDDKERMVKCPECDNTEYPVISPAVIVGVTNGNDLLLSKYAGRKYANYALLAGFTESGETIEETVQREVMEEVGLQVKNIRYYKSQPWGMSSSLLFGFFADLDGSPDITIDKTELSVAEWFPREEIPATNSDISLTNEMIEYFRNNKEKFITGKEDCL
ncbi:MAG: NAD(+) diphosphatase [Candidatus Azobacteroides sp.]|nr:NAD(+) diphosphatase [Candidatus Azobacteroides sp.]